MADPSDVRIRDLRLRVPRRALAGSEAALADAVRRRLQAHLDPAVAEPLAAELARQARAAGGTGRPTGERS